MKGIILAGGTGSRLLPLTRATNKSLLPMGRRTIVEHVLSTLTCAGIDDVVLITGTEHIGAIVSQLGSGRDHGCQMTYRVQDEPLGIAHALGLCESFVGGDRFAVILGDNIFEDVGEVAESVRAFGSSDDDYGLFVKQVSDPERFGVVEYDGDPLAERPIVNIHEKPAWPPSNDAVLGLYVYTSRVFDVIHTLKPSKRGEYEISDVNRHLVQRTIGRAHRVKGGWIDAGTHESYQRACRMVQCKDVT